MRNDPAGILTKIILIYSTMLDFVLASVTVNRFVVARYLHPGFFEELKNDAAGNVLDGDGGYRKKLQWAWYSMPSLMMATTMALLIPRLESLTGLLNSVTGTTVQVTAVALCLFMASGREAAPRNDEENQSLTECCAADSTPSIISMRTRYVLTCVYGVALTSLIFAEAVYSIVYLTDYTTNDFWCDFVGRR